MASINMGTLYAYANGSDYGRYSCVVTYDNPTRNGLIVTIPNLKVTMTRYSTGYTTNRIAGRAGLGGSTTSLASNTTLNSSGTASPATITFNLGSPTYSTAGSTLGLYIALASTGGSGNWDNFLGNSPLVLNTTIAIPGGYPTASINSSSRTVNSVTLNYSFTTATPTNIQICDSAGTVLATTTNTGTYKLTNLPPNSTNTYKIRGYANSGWGAYSNSVAVTTLDHARVTNFPDFNDENSPVLSYTNVAGDDSAIIISACISWTGNDDIAYRNLSKTGNSYTFAFIAAERTKIQQALTTSSMKVNVIVRSVINDVAYYSSKEVNMSIINATPTITSFAYQDTNATTKNLTGSDQIIVKGKSNVRIYNVVASTLKNATKKALLIDGVSEPWSDTFTKTLNAYSKNNVGVAIVDSRNVTSLISTKTFTTFVDYFDITKGAQGIIRNNGVGEGVVCACSGTWFNKTFGQVANTITASYRYRKTGAPTWTTGTTTITVSKSGNNYSMSQALQGDVAAGFNIENSYDIEVTFTDKLSTAVFSLTLIAGTPAISVFGNKVAFGGQFDETQLSKEIQFRKSVYDKNGDELGPVKIDRIYPVGAVYLSTVATSPATLFGGTWTQISGRFLYCTTSGAVLGGSTVTGGTAITVANLPGHTHSFSATTNSTGAHNHPQNTVGNDGNVNPWVRNASGSSAGVYTAQQVAYYSSGKYRLVTDSNGAHTHTVSGTSGSTGSGTEHTHAQNLPPYFTVYAWYRTA